ncbi:MAG: hypothetical protein PHW10_02805 [Candidatus Peribacteraceae bacterium]|nr:hypothetical protein [Candidatus Peribacteraceae bacterium]
MPERTDSALFRNTYRIPSARCNGWDYTSPGRYFVTLCTHRKYPWFGTVRNGFVCLTDTGAIAFECWNDIPRHFPQVTLDTFIIMPNHTHGIVIIGEQQTKTIVETRHVASLQPTSIQPTSKQPASIQPITNDFGPLRSGSLPAIIHAYKSTVTRLCRRHGMDDFAWQPRYHDHIIRNEREMNAIRRYIIHNPIKWSRDHRYP